MTIEATLETILSEIKSIHQYLKKSDTVQPAVIPSPPPAAAAFAVPLPPAGAAPAVPPVPAGAPAAAVGQAGAPPAPKAAGVELDTKGLPWDARIHAGSKAKIANGEWRLKRGVDAELLKKVEAELKSTQAAPTLPGPPIPPAVDGVMTFASLVTKLPPMMAAGTITQEQIDVACQSFGVPNIPALAARPDLVPAVAMSLGVTV